MEIKPKNLNIPIFALGYILKRDVNISKILNESDSSIIQYLENSNLKNSYGNSTESDSELISRMWQFFNEQYDKVTEEWDCFWINSKRATFFVWKRLSHYTYSIPNLGTSINPYHSFFGFTGKTNSHEERVRIIKRYLILFSDFGSVKQLIQHLRNQWQQVINSKLEMKFLQKLEPELNTWIWEKFTQLHLKYVISHIPDTEVVFDIVKRPFPQINLLANYVHNFTPFTSDEIINQIQGEIDNYCFSNITKRILKEKFSQAYSQKKFQLKKQEQMPFNTHIDKATHKQFVRLQKFYGLNKEQTLSRIISEASFKVKNN